MSYPEIAEGTQVCVTVTRDGIKLYGNRQAFHTLSRWMSWIAASEPSEHYECHLLWHLTNYEAKVGQSPGNLWFLFDRDLFHVFEKHREQQSDFDLTFMIVEQHDLEKLAQYRSSGLLPEQPQGDE